MSPYRSGFSFVEIKMIDSSKKFEPDAQKDIAKKLWGLCIWVQKQIWEYGMSKPKSYKTYVDALHGDLMDIRVKPSEFGYNFISIKAFSPKTGFTYDLTTDDVSGTQRTKVSKEHSVTKMQSRCSAKRVYEVWDKFVLAPEFWAVTPDSDDVIPDQFIEDASGGYRYAVAHVQIGFKRLSELKRRTSAITFIAVPAGNEFVIKASLRPEIIVTGAFPTVNQFFHEWD